MPRDYADRGYQSGIGTFDGLGYRDGEMGAIMHRMVDNIAPGSISVTSFYSKTELESEKELLQTDPSKRFGGRKADEAIVSDTLTEINYALEKIDAISPDLIGRMKEAVNADLRQQYQDMGVRGRFEAAIDPEKLHFSPWVDNYTHLNAVAEEIAPEDRRDLTQSIIYNAIGHDSGPHIALGRRNSPVYDGEVAQHQADKNPVKRLVEAVNPGSFEPVAPAAEA